MNKTTIYGALDKIVSYHRTLFVAAVILLAVWQITIFQYTLKWDAIDITLPWRYFVSDALLNSTIPWWNPFQFQGFAQGLSLETWYPLALLLGLVRGYDLYSLNLEYVSHLLIASYGFYRLARALKVNQQGALWGALVFSLSGFFIGNAQHTGWIASGAWIPHVFASFLIWKINPNLKNTLLLAILIFVLVSGGYLAYSIVTAYILFFAGLKHLFDSFRQTKKVEVFWETGRLLFCTFCICSLLIVCLWQLKEQIDRGGGLSGNALYKGSLYFKHLVSLIFPFGTVKGNYELWSGDQSMMNLYMGLFTPILLIISLRHLRSPFYRYMWIAALVSLSLAMAVELPFRGWLNVLPFFDLFRFPSLFRYFSILSFVMIGARIVSDYSSSYERLILWRRLHIKGVGWLLGFLCLCGIIVIISFQPSIFKVLSLSIDSVSEAIVFQVVIHILILLGFLSFTHFRPAPAHFFGLLLFFSALDMVVSCQLNGRVSIFSEHDFSSIQSCLEELPPGYPLPVQGDLIGSNPDRTLQFGPVYRNTNTLYKRVGWDGYTPYQYASFIEFEKTPHYAKSLNLPVLFVSNPVFKQSLSQRYYESDPVMHLSPDEFSITNFGPNEIKASINLGNTSTLVFNQNYRNNWQVFVDDLRQEIIIIDHSLMGVRLSAGPHRVHFKFVPGQLLNALFISCVALILGLVFYLWENRHSPSHGIFLVFCLTMGLLRLLSWGSTGIESSNHTNTITKKDSGEATKDRYLDHGDLERFKQEVLNLRENFNYNTNLSCLAQDHRMLAFLMQNNYLKDSTASNGLIVYHCTPPLLESVFTSHNFFETYVPLWKDQGVSLKTEENNLYQSLAGRKYSSSISIDLTKQKPISLLKISFDHRNTGPMEAAIVCSIDAPDDPEAFWKSLKIEGFDNPDRSWKSLTWDLDIPKEIGAVGILQIYIWNKRETNLEIDNLSVSLVSQ